MKFVAILFLAAAAVRAQEYTCTGTAFPDINTENLAAKVQQASLFPPFLDTGGTLFSGTEFQVTVVTSKFYTAAAGDITVDGASTTQGTTTVAFVPTSTNALNVIQAGTGVTIDGSGRSPSDAGTAIANYRGVGTGAGTPEAACWETKSVKVAWASLSGDGDTDNSPDGVETDTVTAGERRFRGSVSIVSQRPMIGFTFGNAWTRTANDQLFWQVTFPTTATVTFNDLQVFSATEIQVVLTSHTVNLGSLNVLQDNPVVTTTIKFTTTTQYPFRIQDADEGVAPNVIAADLSGAIDDAWVPLATANTVNTAGISTEPGSTCVDNATANGARCTQNWSITTGDIDIAAMQTNQGNCEVDAVFTVTYKVRCQASQDNVNDCPLPVPATTSTFSLTLRTSSLCPQSVVDIDWDTEDLNAYESNSYTTARTAFTVGQNVYFKVDLAITADTPDLATCTFNTITVTPGPISVYAGGVAVCPNSCWIGSELAENQVSGNDCANTFAFTLVAATFPVTQFSSQVFVVEAVIDVTFDGFSKLRKTSSRPELLQAAGDSSSAPTETEISVASVAIQPEDEEPVNGGETSTGESRTIVLEEEGSDMFIYIIIGVCAFVALLIGALVIYLRRSKKEKKSNAITPQVQVQMQPQRGVVTQSAPQTVGMAATA